MPTAGSKKKSLTSRPVELLLSVTREGTRRLGRQIEDQLRDRIRDRRLRPGARLPSTRDLAGELGVSRPIVMAAYAQLAAEGFLELRQGARPQVACALQPARAHGVDALRSEIPPLYDFRPGVPDLAAFPRSAWLRSVREALRRMPDEALGYSERLGSDILRIALSDHLGRVRGIVSDPARIVVTSGWAQGRRLVCRALVATGARRIALEDPCWKDARDAAAHTGLEVVPIPVDDDGLRVDALARASVDAVIVTPAHQYPSGAVLSGERRAALLSWLRDRDAIAVEDDYDAEYRYDRQPVGALQALDPDRIVYAGTASKTLVPALRLGWLVMTPRLLARVVAEQALDSAVPRIDQHALADFLERGELDRHLRRMRLRYRARRDALVDAVARHLPGATVCGIAAGLHATVRLWPGCDELAVQREAAARGIGFATMRAYRTSRVHAPPTLVVGYARASEETIDRGMRELARAVRATGARAVTK